MSGRGVAALPRHPSHLPEQTHLTLIWCTNVCSFIKYALKYASHKLYALAPLRVECTQLNNFSNRTDRAFRLTSRLARMERVEPLLSSCSQSYLAGLPSLAVWQVSAVHSLLSVAYISRSMKIEFTPCSLRGPFTGT